MINDKISAQATFQLGDPENDFTVLSLGLQVSEEKAQNLKQLYSNLSGKKITINQVWIRIEGTTKEEFTKFMEDHQDLVAKKLDIFDFGSGIVVCVDIKELMEQFGMPEQMNPEKFKDFVGKKQNGDSHIRVRLSSGIGVHHAMEVQLKEGVLMFATFLESLTCNLDIQFQKQTYESLWAQYGEMVDEFMNNIPEYKRPMIKLLQSPIQYLDSI